MCTQRRTHIDMHAQHKGREGGIERERERERESERESERQRERDQRSMGRFTKGVKSGCRTHERVPLVAAGHVQAHMVPCHVTGRHGKDLSYTKCDIVCDDDVT